MDAPVRLEIQFVGAGWAQMDLTIGASHYCMPAVSHVFDPMPGLVRATLAAVRSEPAIVRFHGEPREWRWRLTPRADLTEIAIFELPDYHDDTPLELDRVDRRGRLKRARRQPAFEESCPAQAFAQAVLAAFAPWSEKALWDQAGLETAAEYRARWTARFPAEDLALLQRALAT